MFVNEKFYIAIEISMKFVSSGPLDNNSALVSPNRRQAIIWISTDPIDWRINEAVVGDGLIIQ